tara:strand:+ start:81 stop:254 length:174 start_codon:yes stop_codon:yes gene_type:complete
MTDCNLDKFIKKNIYGFYFSTKTFNFFKLAGVNRVEDLLDLRTHTILTYPKTGKKIK